MPDFSAHGLDRSDMALQGAVTALYALQAAMMALLDTALVKTGHSTHSADRQLGPNGRINASVHSKPSQNTE